MKLATHARESQATSLCRQKQIRKTSLCLPYRSEIISACRYHNTKTIMTMIYEFIVPFSKENL